MFHSVLLACVAGGLLGSAAAAEPTKGDVEKASKLLEAGKPTEALALVEPVIALAMTKDAKDPTAMCPGVAIAVAQAILSRDNPNITITIDNDWCDAMLVKAYALNELKRPSEAAQVLEGLVRHDPQNAQYLIEYAYSVRSSGQTERGLDLYKRAETMAGRSKSPHWQAAALRGQGYAYIDLGRWDDAVKAYKKSLKYEPDSDLTRHELEFIERNRPR